MVRYAGAEELEDRGGEEELGGWLVVSLWDWRVDSCLIG